MFRDGSGHPERLEQMESPEKADYAKPSEEKVDSESVMHRLYQDDYDTPDGGKDSADNAAEKASDYPGEKAEEIDGKPEFSETAEEKSDPESVMHRLYQSDHVEEVEKIGGSYRDVKKYSDGETQEVHHMPADSISFLETNDGPAIQMDKEDHRQTASYGSSREAREYREHQKELVDQGKFRDAIQMDIDDIRDKFGHKYDEAISQMLDYVDELEKGGKI